MKKSTKILIPTLALTVFSIAGIAGIESTYASENNNRESIIEKLAQRFNVSESDVQGVFDENRQERQAENQERHEERLNQLVSEGKLTEEQKQLLMDKREEQRAEREQSREESKDMTREERQADREAHKAEMDEWFEVNGIDHDALGGLGEEGGRGRGGQGGHRGGGLGAGK